MKCFLTDKQLDIVVLVANGNSMESVARELGKSVSSVKQTLRRARERAGAKTNTHLVAISVVSGQIVWSDEDGKLVLSRMALSGRCEHCGGVGLVAVSDGGHVEWVTCGCKLYA